MGKEHFWETIMGSHKLKKVLCKPVKKLVYGTPDDISTIRERISHNEAIDDCEAFRKQELNGLADEGNILRVIQGKEITSYNKSWGDFCNEISQEISKYIKGKI